MGEASKPVTFRLGAHYHERLSELGGEQEMSPGEFARKLVTAALDGGDKREILDSVSALRDELDLLREDFGWVLGTLLVNVTDFDKDQVRELLASRFQRAGGRLPC